VYGAKKCAYNALNITEKTLITMMNKIKNYWKGLSPEKQDGLRLMGKVMLSIALGIILVSIGYYL
jgi:hypothetical protein